MKSTAAVLIEPGRIELVEFEVPSIGADDGLLRVEVSGVCGADWDPFYLGAVPALARRSPLILGHEVIGRIEHVGEAAARRWNVADGDRVLVEESIPCGRCALCRAGRYRHCDGLWHDNDGMRYGFTPLSTSPGLWGGYSQFMYLHPNSVLHRAPDDVAAADCTLAQPIANGIEWISRCGGLPVGGHVVVFGPGQAGLGCVIGAREAGAGSVTVVGTARDARRLAAATALGADRTVVAGEAELPSVVADVTNGAMADVVVDATNGARRVAAEGLSLLRIGGVLVLAGTNNMRDVEGLKPDLMINNELVIRGANGHDQASVEAALRVLASGRHSLGVLSTHTYGLEECERAIRTVGGQGDPDPVHVTVSPVLP